MENQALKDISAERERQIDVEGWTLEHDDTHDKCEMSRAAACYAMFAAYPNVAGAFFANLILNIWPWDQKWWKPETRRRDLVKAGALIVAEIERLDRIEAKTSK
ncbi:MAG: hypothetical protein ACMZ66_05555 [Thalassospira sp.]|uniref:hypothetical protein n=1 Tax=Thalassospira sp. TaxID=1912094 RepID=UPI003A87BBC6